MWPESILGGPEAGGNAEIAAAANAGNGVVSVKDAPYNATGDGVTNDAAAIQAAFDSGAKKVIFPAGKYNCGSTALTLPNWLHIEGVGHNVLIGTTGRSVELLFDLDSGAALTTGYAPVIKNIWFQNSNGTYSDDTFLLTGTTARAIDVTDNGVIEECGFSNWYECIRTGASTYYLKTDNLHFNRCTYGYRAVSATPYNIDIHRPHSTRCQIFLAGYSTYYPRNVKIFGGSIEDYEVVAEHFLDLSIFGTYFETSSPRTAVQAIAPGVNGASLSLFGCLIYMNQTERFVNLSGATGVSLTSVGNVFDGVAPASSACIYLPTSGDVHLAGDRFGSGHPTSATYVNSIATAWKYHLVHPVMPAGNAHVNYSKVVFQGEPGLYMGTLSAAPTVKFTGQAVCADGDSWDPLSRAYGRPYWVVWQGDRWYPVGG